MRRATIWGSLIVALTAFLWNAAPSRAETAATASSADVGPAAIIELSGVIDDYSRDQLFKRFDDAKKLGAKTIIVSLNTPGGLVTAGLEISQFFKRQEDVHVVAFIDRKAYSAGTMIALAADEVVMGPGAYIGDAAPIAVAPTGGMETLGTTERAKAESPILADFYDSATRNHYDPLLTEAMVVVGRVVHWVENPKGERKFVTSERFEGLQKEGWKEVDEPGIPTPVDGPDRLLTVSSLQAVKLGLAKGMASSAQALAAERGLAVVATFAPTAGERFVGWLSGAPVRFFLLVVFLVSLYVAMHTPGAGFAEALALTSLGLLVGVPLLTGFAQWWEVVAIFVGLALLALELFVIPGFGVAGIAGIVLIVGGLVLTFVGNAPGLPGGWTSPGVLSNLQTGLLSVTGAMVVSILLSFWLSRFLPKMPYFNRLILTSTSGTAAPRPATLPPLDGPADAWPFGGTVGRAVSDLKPGGTAEFPFGDDRRVTAVVSDSGYVSAGSKIVVKEVSGTRVVVRTVA